jgi:hypothetical protein
VSDGPDNSPEVKGLTNKPLEDFLVRLAVDEELRQRYSAASREEKVALLANEFKIGDMTIDALLQEPAHAGVGAVSAMLDMSDQQAQTTPQTQP